MRNCLHKVTQTKSEVDEAKNLATMAFEETQAAKNKSEEAKALLEQIEEEIKDVLETQGASPEEIRQVAEDVRKMPNTAVNKVTFKYSSRIINLLKFIRLR